MSDDLSDWGDFAAEPVSKASSAGTKDDPFADWSNPESFETAAKGDQGIGWLDPIKGVAAGVTGDVAAVATGVQLGAEKLGYPGVASAAKGVSRGFHQAERIIEESETDAYKKAQGAALIPEQGQEQLGSNIGREALAKGVGVVAPAAVGYAGGTLGAILGSFVGPEGTVAGASAGAAGAGALYGLAKGIDQAVAWTNELTDEELEKEAPVFGKFKQMYIEQGSKDPSYDARVALHKGLYGFAQAASDAAWNAAGFGAGKKLLTGALGKNFGEKAVEYALTGGALGGISASSDVNQQNVENVKQGKDGLDLGKTAIAFLNGTAEGLAFHGAGEAARKLASYMPQKEVPPDTTKRDMSADLFAEKQAVNTPPAGNAASTGVTPKQNTATTQPPPNESAQEGAIGNTVNPPTRDQDPATGKEAAAGAKGKAAVATGKRRMKPGIDTEVEGSVTTLDPAQQAALAQSTPGDPTQVTLAEPTKPVPMPGEIAEPNPQVFAAREEDPEDVYYHGSPRAGIADDFSNFDSDVAFLSKDLPVAQHYANVPTMGAQRGVTEGGTPTVYEVGVKPGNVFDMRKPEHRAIYEQIRAEHNKKATDPDDMLPPLNSEGFVMKSGLPGFGHTRAILPELEKHGFRSMLTDEGSQGVSLAVYKPQGVARVRRTVDPTRAAEVPEAPPTIEAQLSQFTDKQRDVIRFENVDQVPDDLPKGVKEYEADDGSIWWYRGKVTGRQIKKSIKDKTENELLGLGPFNKADVANDVAAGGEPTAAVARAPDGTEVAAAATTDRLAEPTVDALEEANPGATVTLEQPQGVIEGRENGTGKPTEPPVDTGVFDEAAAREQARRDFEEETARAREEGRPLPSMTEDDVNALVETRRREYQIEQEKLAAEERRAKRDLEEAVAEEKEIAPPEAPKDFKSQKNPKRDRERAENRSKSDELFEAHKSGMETSGRTAVLERAKKILADAKERGISIVRTLDYDKNSAGQAFLKEAQVLVGKARAKKGVLSADDLSRFHQAEFDLRDGLEGYDRYKKNARAEGDARYGAKFNEAYQKDAKAKADEARNEVSGELAMRGEGDEFSNDDRESEAQTQTLADAVVDRADEEEFRQEPPTREKPKVELKGDEHTAGKDKSAEVGTKIKVETTKRRTINRPGVGPKTQEAAARAKPETKSPLGETGRNTIAEDARQRAKSRGDDPEKAAAEAVAYHERNFEAIKKEEPGLTSEEYLGRVEAGMRMLGSMMRDTEAKDQTDAARRAAAREEAEPVSRPAMSAAEFMRRREADRKAKEARETKRETGEREGHVSMKYGEGAVSAPIQHTELATEVLRSSQTPRTGLAAAIFPDMRRRLRHLLHDTKVHWVTAEDMAAMDPKNPLGFYKPAMHGEGGYIVLSENMAFLTKAEREQVIMHEMLHAATEEGLIRNPEIKARVTELFNLVKERFPEQHEQYGFENESEFIAEAFSNPEFAQFLADTPVPRDVAARLKFFGRPGSSMFQALTNAIRNYLGLSKYADTALDALVRPVNEAMIARARAVGKGDIPEAIGYQTYPTARPAPNRADITRQGNRAKLSLEAGVEKLKRATLFNTQLVRSARHLGDRFFKSADRANKIFKRMTAERQRILDQEGGADLVREAATLAQRHPEAMREGADIANWAADLQVDPTAGAANDHIFTKDPSRGGQWWIARKQLPEVQAAWADFSSRHPEVADFLQRAAEWGRDAKNKQTREMVEKELETAGLGDPALLNRILKAGEVPDADKAVFSSQVLVDHINRIVEANGRQGWYFPAIREGDYVVTAKREFDVTETSSVKRITTDENGEPVSNMVQFTDPTGGRSALKARRAARDWVQNHTAKKLAGERDQLDTLGKPQQVWVDRNDPTKLLDKSDVDAIPAYRVRMQDEYMSLYESKADATERAEQMKVDGWSDVRDPDLKRLNPNARWGGLIPMQFEAFLNSLRDREKFKNLSGRQQNEMVQALHQSSLKLHPGMRMQHHWVQRKNVMGYQKDIAQAVSRFVTLDAGFRARLRHASDLHEATRDMHDVADEMNDKQNDRRRGIARELEERFYKGEEFQSQTMVDRAIAKLSQFSMVTKLAGPSQPIINSLEPSMVTLPVLAGYHGTVKAMRAMKDAYNAIGARGVLGAGLRDVARAATADHGFTDYREFIKDRIANSGVEGNRAARLGDLIDHLHDLNLFGHEAGMEVQRLTNAETNRFFRAVDRADLMFRQVNQAIEAINRAVTGIAAYELRYAKTKNHFEALDYAHDVVDETMGDYAASNSAPILNSRGGRLAFQFKKYSVKSYGLLGRLAADSFRGDRDAIKAFAGVMVTHGVMAGALGLPGMELVKAALFIPGLMGGYSYDDFQDEVRSIARSMFPEDVATALTRGAPRALGVDTASRMGWENLAMPRDNPSKPEDLPKWLGEAFVGAPGSVPVEVGGALKAAVVDRDFDAAMDKQPSKFVRDVYRAVKGLNSGFQDKNGREKLKPYSIPEAIVQAAGFKPGRAANVQEENSAIFRQTRERTESRRAAINAWVNADPDGKARALKAVQDYNQSLPEGAPRILMKDLTSAAKARRTEKIKGTYSEGVRITKQNRDIVERVRGAN